LAENYILPISFLAEEELPDVKFTAGFTYLLSLMLFSWATWACMQATTNTTSSKAMSPTIEDGSITLGPLVLGCFYILLDIATGWLKIQCYIENDYCFLLIKWASELFITLSSCLVGMGISNHRHSQSFLNGFTQLKWGGLVGFAAIFSAALVILHATLFVAIQCVRLFCFPDLSKLCKKSRKDDPKEPLTDIMDQTPNNHCCCCCV